MNKVKIEKKVHDQIIKYLEYYQFTILKNYLSKIDYLP
jgi:hypothetical protein